MSGVNLPTVGSEAVNLVVRNSLLAFYYRDAELLRAPAVFVAVEPRMILANFVDAVKPLHLLLPRVEIELYPKYYSYRHERLLDEDKILFEMHNSEQGGLMRDPETPQHLVYLGHTNGDEHLAILYNVERYEPPLLTAREKRPGFAAANAVAQLRMHITEIDRAKIREILRILDGAQIIWRTTFTQIRRYVHGVDYSYDKSVMTFAIFRADNGWILVYQREWGSDYGSGRETRIYRAELAEHPA